MKTVRSALVGTMTLAGVIASPSAAYADLVPVGSVLVGAGEGYTRIFVNGNRVYVSTTESTGNTIYRIDATSKSLPAVTGSYVNTEFPVGDHTIDIANDKAYICGVTSSDLLVIDMLASPPQLVGRLGSAISRTRGLDYENGYVHVFRMTASAGAMSIFDVTDPAHILSLPDNEPTVLWPGYVFGNRGYLPYYPNALAVLDLTDRYNWFVQATYSTGPFADWYQTTGLDEQAGYLYRVSPSNGLQIFDTQNAQAIQLRGAATAPSTARAVSVEGAYAYVAAGADGLHVYSVSNAVAPQLQTVHPGDARDVVAAGDYVYLLDGISGTVDILKAATRTHTIKIVNLDWITVDRFEYFDGARWVAVDANSPAIKYNGSEWSKGRCAVSRETPEVGASVELTFTGTGVRWFSAKQQYQLAEIYIDGVYQRNATPSEDRCNYKAYEKTML